MDRGAVHRGVSGIAATAGRALGTLLLACGLGVGPAAAESLADALVRVYQTNPTLNAERARQRATDENVPQALAGYRPQITGGLSAGLTALRNVIPGGDTQTATLYPWTASITVNQTLFNGFKTANATRQAEAQVKSGREGLRGIEQSVLLDGVTAYMDVLSNQSLVDAQKANVAALRETLATTRRRYDAGDVTPTDVSQAEARMSRGLADLNTAEVTYAVSQAQYKQVIGVAPGRLAPAEPVDHLLPRQREEAVVTARQENPAVLGASYDTDAAQRAVNIAQSSLWPNVSVQGNVMRQSQTDTTLGTNSTDSASVVGQAAIPLYDGGLAASQTRQAKETVTQSRLLFERIRQQAETGAVTAWVTNEGARTAVQAGEAEVRAATLALQGVQKELQAGQRTTLDVLNAQQELVGARARLIVANRDRVIASYTLLSAMGRLDAKRIGLNTPDYTPDTHYQQVRDAWHGLRTPSGQ